MPRARGPYAELNGISGIYVIRHVPSGKAYVGKSNDVGRRFRQYLSDIRCGSDSRINEYLFNAFRKHGIGEFTFTLVERASGEDLLRERELHWMIKLSTLSRHYGYNLRYDTSTSTCVTDRTRSKISERLREEWSSGIRDEHSNKMVESWKRRGNEARWQQSKLMSTLLTKYTYSVEFPDGHAESGMSYSDLKRLGIAGAVGNMSRNGTDSSLCHKHRVTRSLVNG